MLTSAFLRFIARDANAIVAFVTKLNDRLDSFLAKHDAEVAAFEADIEIAVSYGKAEIARIEAMIEAMIEDEVETIKSKIEDKAAAAAIVATIKAALPGNTPAETAEK